jgi:A/G-specific adenine glycosylase
LNPDQFASILLRWSSDNQRDLPWKKDKDPYKIWISEIILQQTRVDQGTPYFMRFIEMFPNVKSLAEADEDQVLKLWEGLGYYSRARNLHFTAKLIVEKYDGIFPSDYHSILSLKGVGPYTAAAIASFAFGHKHAVVDGNVLRLVSRLLGITQPIDTNLVKKQIENFVQEGIVNTNPALYNQALMDFGATFCTSSNPNCNVCPFQEYCIAYHSENVQQIPNKSKKILRKDRFFHFFDFQLAETYTILTQRKETDIWNKLFQLPLMETRTSEPPNLIEVNLYFESIFGNNYLWSGQILCIKKAKQLLTHQNIYGFFYKISVETIPDKINQDHYLVERTKVSNFAFPKIIADYLKNKDL